MSKIIKSIEKAFDIIDAYKTAKLPESPGGEKVTLSEKIGLMIKGIGLVKVLAAFGVIKTEWQNRTDETKQEIIDVFATRFSLKNEETELAIEQLVSGMLMFENALDMFKKN